MPRAMGNVSSRLALVVFAVGWSAWGICQSLPCPAFGEKDTRYTSEVGLNLIGLVTIRYIEVLPNPVNPRLSVLNGVNFKRRSGRHAYRVSIDAFRNSFELGQGTPDKSPYFIIRGHSLRTELRVGYENHLTKTRFRPYWAVDVGLGYECTKADGEGRGGFMWGVEPGPYSYDLTTKRITAGLSIGISYRLSHYLSIGVETSVYGMYEQQEYTLSTTGGPGDPGTGFGVDPVRSFWLQYHLSPK